MSPNQVFILSTHSLPSLGTGIQLPPQVPIPSLLQPRPSQAVKHYSIQFKPNQYNNYNLIKELKTIMVL